jgi:hypothetical protein
MKGKILFKISAEKQQLVENLIRNLKIQYGLMVIGVG